MTEEGSKVGSPPTGAGELFQLLRDGQPRTRAALAQLTGQARSSIAAQVGLLIASGFVGAAGEAQSTGGRPPTTFAFNPSARIVLAVDVGATHVSLAVTDLAQNVLAEREEPIVISQGPDIVLEHVATLGSKLVAEAGRSMSELVSVGVGLPGPVEHSTGRPIDPPIMPGWHHADVPGYLGERLRASVLVDNDVNLMALGEHSAVWPDVDHLFFVKVATGIGAGIISDGQILRGAQGTAGNLGHVAVPGGLEVPCLCGHSGCLEAIASGQAIVEGLRKIGVNVATSTDVVTLVRAGNLTATHAVREAGRDIGRVLATCVTLLNPSMIVVGGIVSEAGEHLLAGIREVVYRRSLPLATQHLRIVTTQTKGRAGVLGASYMAAEDVLSPAAIDAFIG